MRNFKVGKMRVKKQFSNCTIKSGKKIDGENTRQPDDMKKALYLHILQ